MITLRGITLRRGTKVVLSQANLTLQPGEKVTVSSGDEEQATTAAAEGPLGATTPRSPWAAAEATTTAGTCTAGGTTTAGTTGEAAAAATAGATRAGSGTGPSARPSHGRADGHRPADCLLYTYPSPRDRPGFRMPTRA